LRDQRIDAAHSRRRLLRLQLRGVEFGLRGALRGARTVDVFRRYITV
jgi:hypothetical protein